MNKLKSRTFLLGLILLTACGSTQTATQTEDTATAPTPVPAPDVEQLLAQVKKFGAQGLPRTLQGVALPDLTEQRFGRKRTGEMQSQAIQIDHGADGLDLYGTQGFWATHSVDFGLELPQPPSTVSGYYIYGPTSLGPTNNCLEVLTSYSRTPSDAGTQRQFMV